MAERVVNSYKRLFEIRLLHHYWLDDGATLFDLIPSQKRREERLLSYDMRSLLAMMPTDAAAKALKGLCGVYKNTALGCVVAVPDRAVVPLDAMFEFVVTVQSADFFNYSALTLRPQKIYELYHQPENKTYRYKENVPVLSNLTGASRTAGLGKALFLSKEIPALAADDQVESLVLSGNALVQLVSDQPGAGTQQLNAIATNLPVFVHQGDMPSIVPPNGLSAVPKRGITLSGDIVNNVFAVIRLSAVRADDNDFSFVDANGHARTPNPVFQVRFKNRSTFWSYFDKKTGAPVSTETNPLSLTYFGNAGTKQKPSTGLVKAISSGTRITQLVSEVFI